MRTAKTLTWLGGCQGWSSLHWAHTHFVDFVMSRLRSDCSWSGSILFAIESTSFLQPLNLSHLMTKTNKTASAPSEDSDQPDQSLSCLLEKKLGSLTTYWAHSEDLSEWADAQVDLSLRSWADLSLRWARSHFVGFVMWWLIWILLLL